MITDTVLKFYKKAILSSFSDTEKEALNSGSVCFEGELYRGKPNWDVLFSLPKPKFSKEEQAFIDGPVDELCRMIDDWQLMSDKKDGYGDLPPKIWDFIKKKKFFGMMIEKKYGGLGFSAYAHSEVVMKISSRSITAGVTVMVPNSLGPGELLHEYGTKAQKDYYLPRLADGREIPCFALTGPHAGSDATSLPDTGVVFKQKDGTLAIKLNWDKRYITLGPVATLVGLAFQMKDPNGLLGGKKDIGITCALIPSDIEGITIGDRHHPMSVPFQNGPNQGKDVIIPLDYIIGGVERAGQGWKMLMECLSIGRSISLPAQSTAGAKLSTRLAGAYSRIRKQFKTSINNFEGIEEVLARIAGRTYMMDGARIATVQMVDRGERPSIPSAILKYHHTENMRKSINDAMDIHGGKAICEGPDNLFSTIYKSIPVAITVEGANIMTRNLIICGQGIIHAHPQVPKQIKAAEAGDAGALTKHLLCHVGSTLWNMARCFVHSATLGHLTCAPVSGSETRRYYQMINMFSARFNVMANISLAYFGGNLKRKERITARLGDVLSHMYLASCTLRHFETQGRKAADVPLLDWAVRDQLHLAEKAMDDLLNNYPNIFVRGFLKFITKPLRILPFKGHVWHKAPTDKLDNIVTDLITAPGAVRDRLTHGIFLKGKPKDQIVRLEDALKKVIAAEPFEKKVRKAIRSKILDAADKNNLKKIVKMKILTAKEADVIKASTKARFDIISVNAFEDKANQKLRADRLKKSKAKPAKKTTAKAKIKTKKAVKKTVKKTVKKAAKTNSKTKKS